MTAPPDRAAPDPDVAAHRDPTVAQPDAGQPGSPVAQGNTAEAAAFTGDGAYSGGQAADLDYPNVEKPLQD